ncbi:uncharacterized protein H6S33_008069 [Morchella sextelata]|uniref:uncharacterized protein n=1 Tax=Morchella sextelata TaxID=1174677 RepID=UPI001D0586D4|nr:uncharacterized protein H6S33_008069 [Morchella sextelata]KAH0603065.1 hypothetical protein H6S33_008069 [Morchella sextelata]
MVHIHLRGDSHGNQVSVSSPSVRTRYLNLHRGTTRAPTTPRAEHTHAATHTPQAEHTDPATPPTPHNPAEAFHATRTQTIASFRTVAAETATASDMSFIFDAIVALSPTDTTPSSYVAPSDSDAAKSTPSMGQLAPPRYSGSTRDIEIDSHKFMLPTDAVHAFLETREMTIAAFRMIAAGEAAVGGGRDMAFVFGTAIFATPEGTRIVEGEGDMASQAHITDGERTPAPISEETDEIEVHEVDEDEDKDYATPASSGGRSPRSWQDLTPAVPFLSEGLRRRAVGDTVQAVSVSIASTSTPIMTPAPTPKNTLAPAPPIPPIPTPPTATPPRIANHLPSTFLGNFPDLDNAELKLGRSNKLLSGMYIDGWLSIGGKFAATTELVGEERCCACVSRADENGVAGQAVCKVLTEEDPVGGAFVEDDPGMESGCVLFDDGVGV